MAKEIENEDGTKETLYTKDELDAVQKERDDALKSAEDAKRLASEKTDNFKRLNEMTEEEKKAYDANTLELLKRNDLTATENADLKKRLDERDALDLANNKSSVAGYYHQGDEKIKESLEESYKALAGMPEVTKEDIAKRYEAAAKIVGIQVNSGPNPLYQPYNGEAPKSKESKEFVETAKGTEAADMVRDAMGIKKPEPKK